MNAWRMKAPVIHLKNELCHELNNDYQVRVQRKVLKALKLFVEYR